MERLKWLLAFSAIALITSSLCYAEEWAITYGGTGLDAPTSIQQTIDSGYIVVGHTTSFPGSPYGDVWVLRLNPDGTVAWQKKYDYAMQDIPSSIQQTFDQEGNPDGYIVAGITIIAGSGDDCWVLKLNSDGTVAWQKKYGGSEQNIAYSIQQTTDGGFIMAGKINDPGDYWILKLNSNGDVTWQKKYDGGDIRYNEKARSIQQTFDQGGNPDGYIVAGASRFGPLGSEPITSDAWILKLDSRGDVTWQKKYGGSEYDAARSIQQTFDQEGNPDGYIVAGYSDSFGAGSRDFWVLKLDKNGEIPGCSAISTSEIIVSDTSAEVQDTTISPLTPFARFLDTNITPQNTEAEISVVCMSIDVDIDIKPGSCPNRLTVKSKSVSPVAVLGTEDFDVFDVDPNTILLTREGYEDYGVTPIRWSYEDVATPFEGELCDCLDLNGDGYLDLTLKFKTQELAEILNLDLEEVAGQTIPLILTGNLKEEEGGTPIKGSDCIKILETGKKKK